MTRRLLVAAVLAGSVAALAAQAPPLAVTAPALTEIEQAYRTILQLRIALATVQAEADACRAQLGPLRAEAASRELSQDEANLRALIERGHPGYTWDPKTGAFTAKPAEPPPPKK